MPSDSAEVALVDIRDNVELAWRFVEGYDVERFCNDRLVFYAVVRALEIVSEASRQLPNDLRERHPDLPWRAIRDVGNLYRHQYDDVSERLVWNTVQAHLKPLHDAVVHELLRKPTE